jgi:selenocysteine lyase/cysteine desulfurase
MLKIKETKLKKLPEKKVRISTDVILTKETVDHLFDAIEENEEEVCAYLGLTD